MASEPENKKTTIILKSFGDRNDGSFAGATAFGNNAEMVSSALGVETKAGRNGDPYVSIHASQIEILRQKIGRDVDIDVQSPKFKAYINENKSHGSVFGRAAITLASVLGVTAPMTEGEKPKPYLRFSKDKIPEYEQILSKYADVEIQVNQSNHKPKIRFNEADLGETAYVFDRSAENVAELLGIDLCETPGGRPMIQFPDRASYLEARKALNDLADVTIQDYNPKIKIATYQNIDIAGAVIQGKYAADVAVIAGLSGLTSESDFSTGGKKHTLKIPFGKVDAVKNALEEYGYTVELKPLDIAPQANIRTTQDGGFLFGKPAERIAEHMGLELKQTSGSTPRAMLKLTNKQLDGARSILKKSGYELNEKRAKQSGGSKFQQGKESRLDASFINDSQAIAEHIFGIQLQELDSVEDQTVEVGGVILEKSGGNIILTHGDTTLKFDVNEHGFIDMNAQTSTFNGQPITPGNLMELGQVVSEWKHVTEKDQDQPKSEQQVEQQPKQQLTAMVMMQPNGSAFVFGEDSMVLKELKEALNINITTSPRTGKSFAVVEKDQVEEAKSALIKQDFRINIQTAASVVQAMSKNKPQMKKKIKVSTGRE